MNSPTPWYVHSVTGGIYDSNNNYVSPNGDDDSRRIVACVNACEGIPTEALQNGKVASVISADSPMPTERDRLSREVSVLRAALEPLKDCVCIALRHTPDTQWSRDLLAHVQIARKALNQTQGEG